MMLYMMRSNFERLVYMPIFKTTFHDSSFCKKKSICTSKKIHIGKYIAIYGELFENKRGQGTYLLGVGQVMLKMEE